MLPLPRGVVVDEVVLGLVIVESDDPPTPAHADDHLLLLGDDDAGNFRLRERLQMLQVLSVLEIPDFDGPISPAWCGLSDGLISVLYSHI